MTSALRVFALSFALLGALPPATRAEVSEITVAQQYGVSFLPLMVMEKNALIQKHAAQAGLPDIKVSWVKVAGPSAMNDGLIANSLHFAAQGAPSMITLWDKTRAQIKGVSAMTTYPLYLITRNPAVMSIKDFGANDKIAVPSIKISTQAIMLQMAASKGFGDKDFARLDPLTVSLSHPDATLAFTNNAYAQGAPDYAALMAAPDRSDADRVADKRRDPVPFLAFAGMMPGMKVLDMGAGAGYSTEFVARVIGPTGTVYGQNPPDNFERARNAFALRAAAPAMKNSVTLLRPTMIHCPQTCTISI